MIFSRPDEVSSISDLAPATLPLDPVTTVFELQTEEGGIQVSRKVSAAETLLGLGLGGLPGSGADITWDTLKNL